jgi:transposase
MGGRRRLALAQERDWLLARLAAEPDLTLRALLAELIDRKVVVSYGAVWNFFASEGITFKKKPARGRARPTRRRTPARPLEEVSRPA